MGDGIVGTVVVVRTSGNCTSFHSQQSSSNQ